MNQKHFYVYILTNSTRTVLYTGVTNNLERRVWEHQHGATEGFTKRYKLTRLVYCEEFTSPREAIAREKQIKAGSRRKKLELIQQANPDWRDLYEDF